MQAHELAERLRVALGLSTAGIALHRQTLKRSLPAATEQELDAALAAWIRHRPGAAAGDGPQPEDHSGR